MSTSAVTLEDKATSGKGRGEDACQPTQPARHAGGVTAHSEGETEWWCDCREDSNGLITLAAEESSCTHILVGSKEYQSIRTQKKVVVFVQTEKELEAVASGAKILASSERVYDAAKRRGNSAGLHVKVRDLELEFEKCIELCERDDEFVVIDIEHATYIPYELLIAKVQSGRTKVLRSVPIGDLNGIIDPIDQSLNAFSTMEQGIGVLFRTTDTKAIEDLSERVAGRQNSKVDLVNAVVTEVKHTGLGHRVCVDTTSMMSAEEGMLVGSTGWGGILVCSETHYLPHMNLREFRVNAGAVHSYIWGSNGSALYLGEMQAGSEVLCVDLNGAARVVTVGRAKTERRPMINIKCRVPLDRVPKSVRRSVEHQREIQQRVTPKSEKLAREDMNYIYINAFLQNDWHVRVMGADGKVRHSATLKPGDEILAHVDVPGRHTGLRVNENILEK